VSPARQTASAGPSSRKRTSGRTTSSARASTPWRSLRTTTRLVPGATPSTSRSPRMRATEPSSTDHSSASPGTISPLSSRATAARLARPATRISGGSTRGSSEVARGSTRTQILLDAFSPTTRARIQVSPGSMARTTPSASTWATLSSSEDQTTGRGSSGSSLSSRGVTVRTAVSSSRSASWKGSISRKTTGTSTSTATLASSSAWRAVTVAVFRRWSPVTVPSGCTCTTEGSLEDHSTERSAWASPSSSIALASSRMELPSTTRGSCGSMTRRSRRGSRTRTAACPLRSPTLASTRASPTARARTLPPLVDGHDLGGRGNPLHSHLRKRSPAGVERARLDLTLLAPNELELRGLHLDLCHGGSGCPWRGAGEKDRGEEKDRRGCPARVDETQGLYLLLFRCVRVRRPDQGCSTTLPKALRSASRRCASRASERGSTRSTTGRSLPISTSRAMRCRSPLLPMVEPSSESRR